MAASGEGSHRRPDSPGDPFAQDLDGQTLGGQGGGEPQEAVLGDGESDQDADQPTVRAPSPTDASPWASPVTGGESEQADYPYASTAAVDFGAYTAAVSEGAHATPGGGATRTVLFADALLRRDGSEVPAASGGAGRGRPGRARRIDESLPYPDDDVLEPGHRRHGTGSRRPQPPRAPRPSRGAPASNGSDPAARRGAKPRPGAPQGGRDRRNSPSAERAERDRPSLRLSAGAYTAPGRESDGKGGYRPKTNQDRHYIGDGWYAGADSMGSVDDKGGAAEAAISAIPRKGASRKYADIWRAVDEVVKVAERARHNVHQYQQLHKIDGEPDPDTTLSAVHICTVREGGEDKVYAVCAGVGDTTINLIRDGRVIQLLEEETTRARRIRRGEVDPKGGEELTNSVGGSRQLIRRLPDDPNYKPPTGSAKEDPANICIVPLREGDRIVIATDGVTGDTNAQALRPEEWKEALRRKLPTAVARRLVRISRQEGHKVNDDATAVVVQVEEKKRQRGLFGRWGRGKKAIGSLAAGAGNGGRGARDDGLNILSSDGASPDAAAGSPVDILDEARDRYAEALARTREGQLWRSIDPRARRWLERSRATYELAVMARVTLTHSDVDVDSNIANVDMERDMLLARTFAKQETLANRYRFNRIYQIGIISKYLDFRAGRQQKIALDRTQRELQYRRDHDGQSRGKFRRIIQDTLQWSTLEEAVVTGVPAAFLGGLAVFGTTTAVAAMAPGFLGGGILAGGVIWGARAVGNGTFRAKVRRGVEGTSAIRKAADDYLSIQARDDRYARRKADDPDGSGITTEAYENQDPAVFARYVADGIHAAVKAERDSKVRRAAFRIAMTAIGGLAFYELASGPDVPHVAAGSSHGDNPITTGSSTASANPSPPSGGSAGSPGMGGSNVPGRPAAPGAPGPSADPVTLRGVSPGGGIETALRQLGLDGGEAHEAYEEIIEPHMGEAGPQGNIYRMPTRGGGFAYGVAHPNTNIVLDSLHPATTRLLRDFIDEHGILSAA